MSRAKRMEDLLCSDWTPLTEEELTNLNPIGLTDGDVSIDRTLLARLLGERDRLQCVLESGNWLIEEFIKAGFIDREHYCEPEPDQLERAVYALRNAIGSCK